MIMSPHRSEPSRTLQICLLQSWMGFQNHEKQQCPDHYCVFAKLVHPLPLTKQSASLHLDFRYGVSAWGCKMEKLAARNS